MSQFGEPWRIERGRIFGEKGLVFGNFFDDGGGITFSSDELARLVACVNFCGQFPTEFLERRQLLFLKEGDCFGDRSCADIPNFDGKVAVVLNAEMKNVVRKATT